MPANAKQVIAFFEARPDRIKKYFSDLPSLIKNYKWEISISYVFSQIEVAKHSVLYCGIVKLHEADATLTWDMLNRDHMSRARFKELFKIVFGCPIAGEILRKLSDAEAVRDKVAHGKFLREAEARQCLADAIEFSALFDESVFEIAGFHPFGDLRGFKGRRESLSKSTTRWVLRGMGIPANQRGIDVPEVD